MASWGYILMNLFGMWLVCRAYWCAIHDEWFYEINTGGGLNFYVGSPLPMSLGATIVCMSLKLIPLPWG